MRGKLVAVLAALLFAALPAVAQAQDENVLRIGWEQDPQTLSPFTDQDEESYRIWAINYDLLVNFSPDNLAPSPGIAESWDVSDDKKTVTFTLGEGLQWSDGEPLTSKDVKYSLDTLGRHGLLFSSYTENIASVQAPDATTVVVKMKRPDTRIIGGMFVYILPEHVWGRQTIKQLTGSYRPEAPIVGSGPYVVTEFDSNRIVRMERNPNFRGESGKFEELHWIKYGSADAVERALTLGEVDVIPEVDAATFARLDEHAEIEAVNSPSPSFTQLSFNMCPRAICPDARFNPAVQDRVVRQAIGFSVDRERINQIAARGTAFPGHGLLPSYYKDFYTEPEGDLDYPFDPDRAREMLEAAGWVEGEGGVREKGDQRLSFDLFVRSESQENIQAARLVKELTADVGIEFKVQVVSVDRLTELTVREVDGKMAPDFDTFIWGWGGDPYDPGILLNLLTTSAIGGSSDSFYANPEYDRLYQQQSGEFDVAARKEIVRQMIEVSQRDLPYLVLTVDPILQAYRTDRVAGVEQSCPKPDGDILCDQVSYAPFLAMEPVTAAAAASTSGSDDDGGSSGLLYVLIAAALVVVGLGVLIVLRRRRRDREAIEV
ncbi:MAG TPA: ABC transporter substrate-binding protein [Solirubrobacteraceae bacterium]|nr:ABC transporter substrate-binding protein [Solirubrobacteraceae bacterium]